MEAALRHVPQTDRLHGEGRLVRRPRSVQEVPTVICAAREHPIERESPAKGICADCFNRLPKVTRDLYTTGQLSIRRVGELARSRNTSYKELRPRRFAQK